LSRFACPAVSVPPIVIWPLAFSVVVAAAGPMKGPAVEMLAPAGTVMSQPVTTTAPEMKSPEAVMGPFTVTSSPVDTSKSPPPNPPCTRTSPTVTSRSAV